MRMISTGNAPAAIGPYSQAIIAENLVFSAGQLPLDPQTGELVADDIRAQTERVLDNHAAVLRASGSDLGHVLRATVYLVDLADFVAMNAVYAERFGEHKPARTTVGVAALPRRARILIDVVAVLR